VQFGLVGVRFLKFLRRFREVGRRGAGVLADTFGRADGSVPLAAPADYVAQAPRSYGEADARQ
jgi:hypothetical protein